MFTKKITKFNSPNSTASRRNELAILRLRRLVNSGFYANIFCCKFVMFSYSLLRSLDIDLHKP